MSSDEVNIESCCSNTVVIQITTVPRRSCLKWSCFSSLLHCSVHLSHHEELRRNESLFTQRVMCTYGYCTTAGSFRLEPFRLTNETFFLCSVPLWFGGLESTSTQLPMGSYSVPLCQPNEGVQTMKRNLGQALSGELIESSPYVDIRMKEDLYCQVLCVSDLGSASNGTAFAEAIADHYHLKLILDGLPAAYKWEDDSLVTTRYWQDIPLGFRYFPEDVTSTVEQFSVNNHFNLEILYTSTSDNLGYEKHQITRFTVETFSIEHDFQEINGDIRFRNPLPSCDTNAQQHTNYDMVTSDRRRPEKVDGKTLFTYDVIWRKGEVPAEDRWDIYTSMDHAIPVKIHWMSIANSLFYALSLSGLVAVLLLRNVRDNIDDEDAELAEDDIQESLSEKGYSLVHVDSFHPPDHRIMLLAIFSGTGAQLFVSFLVTVAVSLTGLLHSSARGRLVMCALISFKLCGVVNGVVTIQVMKLFKATNDWKVGATFTMLFFPCITFALFLCQQGIAMSHGSILAVDISVIAELVALWFLVLAPLTYLGAFLSSKLSLVSLPKEPRTLLLGFLSYRSIRNGDRVTKGLCVLFCLLFNFSWLVIGLLWALRFFLVNRGLWRPDFNMIGVLLTGGVVCFGATFVENYYIMASIWMRLSYESFHFLFLVAVIFFWTCAMVSVLFNYAIITVEGCHSWWWQFLCSGAAGFWIGVYSSIYSFQLELSSFSSILLYSGFMAWASFAVFLMSGFIGFLGSIVFVRTIFSMAHAGKTILSEEQGTGIALQETTGNESEKRNLEETCNSEQTPADTSVMAVDATLA